MAKLKDFISLVKEKGIARTNRYSLVLPRLTSPTTNHSDHSGLVSVLCDQIQLPSSNYTTVPIRSWGETREVPTEIYYETITVSVYVDTDMKVKEYFDSWMEQIHNHSTRTYNYYDTYAKQVQINVESINSDDEGKSVYTIYLHKCYPKNIGPIQMDYASNDLMKMNVTLTFKYWDKEREGSVSIGDLQTVGANPIQPESLGNTTGITRIVDSYLAPSTSLFPVNDITLTPK